MMPKADSHSTSSRRALLRRSASAGVLALAGATVIAATGPSASAGPADPDAALIAACAAYRRACIEQGVVMARPLTGLSQAQVIAIDCHAAALADRMAGAVETAAALPAQTQGGLRAKARVIRHVLHDATGGSGLDVAEYEVRLIESLVTDVLNNA
jgi:hypothetical protein